MAKNFCPNCGYDLKGGEKFCPSCGQDLKHSSDKKRQTTKPHTPHQRIGRTAIKNSDTGITAKLNNPGKSRRHSDVVITEDNNGQKVVRFRNLHKNAVILFMIQYVIKTSILILLFAAVAVLQPVLMSVAFIAYFIVLYLFSKLTYVNYEFEVTPVAFHKQHGILLKRSVSIAFDQIQNINVRRSVLDQILGLAHLEVETAGTGGTVKKSVAAGLASTSEGYIPGITPEEAREVRELMLARIQDMKTS